MALSVICKGSSAEQAMAGWLTYTLWIAMPGNWVIAEFALPLLCGASRMCLERMQLPCARYSASEKRQVGNI